MLKYLAIPIVIGVITGIALAVTFEDDNKDDDILLSAQKLIKDGSPIMGDKDSEITILEFGDYQCTFCFRFHQSTLKTLEKDYIDTGKVRLVFKDFPLNGPDSVLAAEASYCAEDQGKYWEYHDELYTNWAGEKTGWITRDSLDAFAKTVNLNLEEFNRCLDSGKYNKRVLDHQDFARQIGVDATPSFFIFNDEKIIKIRGNQPLDVFKRVIDDLKS
ncbi:disulfide bond formation protein DsbA [Nitrosopumilus sp. b1]|uniref:DsbA family protein n=1 Tax=Nitrosopumilus sp. b1 TaxID=2109907 RepID=UPI0015F76E66|nr:thioredoxin domain-containing protein [Nitrosopumilus sp. b1]KAF6242680.1 disulfide bond formation protein DsbA [Nitrosopumilus sp. b1]